LLVSSLVVAVDGDLQAKENVKRNKVARCFIAAR
jgi:hypothetical protein